MRMNLGMEHCVYMSRLSYWAIGRAVGSEAMIPVPFMKLDCSLLRGSLNSRSKLRSTPETLPLFAPFPSRLANRAVPVLLILLLQCPCYLFAHQPTSKPDDWREDLRVLSTYLPQLHKNLFFQMSPVVFDDAVAELEREIPALSDEQITLRFAEIVAKVGDAHTSLSLTGTSVPFRIYPIRLQWFSDGLFVTRASPEWRGAIGCQLVQIGENNIQQVYEEVGKLVSHENEPWKKCISGSYLVIPEVLHGLGLLNDEENARFVFQRDTGERISLDLKPIPRTQAVDWISPFDSNQIPRPLYMKNPGSGFFILG